MCLTQELVAPPLPTAVPAAIRALSTTAKICRRQVALVDLRQYKIEAVSSVFKLRHHHPPQHITLATHLERFHGLWGQRKIEIKKRWKGNSESRPALVSPQWLTMSFVHASVAQATTRPHHRGLKLLVWEIYWIVNDQERKSIWS